MKTIEIITNFAAETRKTGQSFAQTIKQESVFDSAFIIALEGNLGSGKTTFIQGLADGLGIKEDVLSPTFLILKQFSIKQNIFINLYHIDAYRLKNSEELLELGFGDIIKNPENIIIIEWADKVRKILPKNIIWIQFLNLNKNKRKIIISHLFSERVMSPSGHGLRSKSEGESLSEHAGRVRKARK